MGSRGASHPKKRGTDPAPEHCDPYELVDRAREGELDESTRRRLTMVLQSQRDAALELAWMQLFDEVREPPRRRERREEERSEHERTERVVRQIVARLDRAAATPVDDATADDARTRRWPAVDAEGRPLDEDARTRRWQAIAPDPDRLDELDEHPTKLHPVLRDVTALEMTRPDAMTFDALDPTLLDPTPLDPTDSMDEAHTRRWTSVDVTALQPPALPPRRRRTGQTAPWSAASALRRDPTPRSTPLDSRRRSRSWIALGLTAALSIATGWLAHGWWNAIEANDAPPVMASPPTSR